MGTFCLLRKTPLGRRMDAGELAAFADLLWYWFHARREAVAGPSGCSFGAHVYAFARGRTAAIRAAVAARLPTASIDTSDSDELRVVGPVVAADELPDPSLWREVLAEPAVADTCLRLRITLTGAFARANGVHRDGTSTFVLCGSPTADAGFVLRGLWRLGRDERMQAVFRGARWQQEPAVLAALDLYLADRSADPTRAAEAARRSLGPDVAHLFWSDRTEGRVLWLTRQLAELPGERGPAALARRVTAWGTVAAALATVAVLNRTNLPIVLLALYLTAWAVGVPGRIVVRRARRIATNRRRMRDVLGGLYGRPLDARLTDLSADRDASLLKFSAEVEDLGGRHVCDVSLVAGKTTYDANRLYVTADAVVALALLRQTETLRIFPGQPILSVTTRFADGSRQVTINRPVYRKPRDRRAEVRCLPERAGPSDVLNLHHRRVRRRVAAGGIVVPPGTAPADHLAVLHADHERERQLWTDHPYSWSDAVHAAFKVCRREYRADQGTRPV